MKTVDRYASANAQAQAQVSSLKASRPQRLALRQGTEMPSPTQPAKRAQCQRAQCKRASRQRGAAAIALALLAVLATGAIMVASYAHRASSGSAISQASTPLQNAAAADWALRLLSQYVMKHGQAPCVARTKGGAADCSAGAKGYLPTSTLEPLSSGGQSPYGDVPMLYMVYRGDGSSSDPDFTQIKDVFSPLNFDGSAVDGYEGVLSTFDLCASLRALSPGTDIRLQDMGTRLSIPRRSDRAHLVNNAGDVTQGIVMAVAAGGNSADGVNSDLGNPSMRVPSELPEPSAAQVRYLDAKTLFDRLRCTSALSSVNLLATGQNISKLAASIRSGNMMAALTALPHQQLFVASSTFATFGAGVDFASAFELLAANAAKAVVNPPLAPLYVWGMTEAEWSKTFAVVDLVRFPIGAITDEAYYLSYAAATIQTDSLPSWGGGIDFLETADRAGMAYAQ